MSEETTFSVSELADEINGVLRRSFADGVWVRGEIQGWSPRGVHTYFRLVEETPSGKASLNVQFFANAQAKVKPLLMQHGLQLADGLKVRIFGRLDFFAPSGQLGLKMTGIDPRFTLGELALQRDDVVRRLVASGLYDRNRQVVLSPVPLRVGVVTSLTSAAWADFQHEIERSGLGFILRTVDVHVQGEYAVGEVSAALRTLGRRADLDAIAVIRGGGSRSELTTFDHETIATEIATCPLPVFTGIGHEIDRAIADEVAHSALKTPTACAAALVERVLEFWNAAEGQWSAITQRAELGVAAADAEVAAVAQGIRHRVVAAVERGDERMVQRAHRLTAGVERQTERAVMHLDAVAQRVRLLDPTNTMARGWSITRTTDGRTVRTAAELQPGDEIVTTFASGTARSRVEETHP